MRRRAEALRSALVLEHRPAEKIGRSFFIYPIDMLFLLCYNDHGGGEGLVSYN